MSVKKNFFVAILALCFWSYYPSVGRADGQFFFRENTFEKFVYPDAVLDSSYSAAIEFASREQFPQAHNIRAESYVTVATPRTVVSHYMRISRQRFFKQGESFTYIFSESGKKPMSRIEIMPVEIPFVRSEFWPTRINLIMIGLPLSIDESRWLDRSTEDLKARVGRLCYPGELREDIARLEMEQIGTDGEVYIVATKDAFPKVVSFFQHRLGKIWVIPARDGAIMVRDFEIDATLSAGFDPKEKELHIRAEENPIVSDSEGNSQRVMGYTFIHYVIWDNRHKN
ncbi:hypothetical protein JW992_03005 [candidate division KSB1 bacterium]|nr:hypothetical protein [candidate division KSB1 bacterium]